MSSGHMYKQMGQSVGSKIRAERLAQRFTQKRLAQPEFSVSYISAIERGQIHPSLRALEILAQCLGLPSTHFLPDATELADGSGNQASIPTHEEKIALSLVEAQVYILQGELPQAVAQLKGMADKTQKSKQQAEIHYLLGLAYLKATQWEECERALAEAAQLAGNSGNAYLDLHILHSQGMAYTAMGKHTLAHEQHQQCLKLLENGQPQDKFLIARTQFSLGQSHICLKDSASAITMFQHAIALLEELMSAEQLLNCYWLLAQHYSSIQDYSLATVYTHKCLYLYSQQAKSLLRSSLYHSLGQVMLKGDAEEARAFFEAALQRVDVQQDQLALTSLTTHLAEWYFAHNALEEATQYAQQAYKISPFGCDTLITARTLLALGKCEYAQAQCEQGDTHFVAGLDTLKRLGLYNELAIQAAHYGGLLEGCGKLQEAIAYFKLAYESKQKGNRER